MTIDLDELARRYCFRNFCLPLQVSWFFITEAGTVPDCIRRMWPTPTDTLRVACRLVIIVPDRETLRKSELANLVMFDVRELARGPDRIASRLRDALRDLVSHEVDESLHVDGVRVFDPHQ